MSEPYTHLLVISLGPVQEFILAARRTRDLWMGSTILSEVSAEVARNVADHGELIFPAEAPPEEPGDARARVANVILALVNAPDKVAAGSRIAANKCWKDFAAKALERAQTFINRDIWDAQVDDVLEFYAAWYPMSSGYEEARQQVMRLLAARKNCRTFLPARGFEGVPKSSLDGARESVLIKGRPQPVGVARALRLSEGEQLDSVGVIKRLALPRTYPSVARVAADPWLRGLKEQDRKELARLCDEVDAASSEFLRGFEYDGEMVYRGRYKALQEEGQIEANLGSLTDFVKALEKQYGEPYPYFAVLSADGDRMGKVLSGIGDQAKHQEFSRDLARFAGAAERIVQDEQGKLVYSGGDDVLAFVALDRAVACARKLHDQFRKELQREVTLSVGVSIGHFMDPLEDHLEWARKAEKHAKGSETDAPRNGLAVHFHPRSSAPLELRAQWSDGIDERLEHLADLHIRNEIPDKAAYQLRQLSLAYVNWPENSDEERANLRDAIRADVLWLIGRKERKDKDKEGPLVSIFGSVSGPRDVRSLAGQVVLARHLAEAKLQALGRGKSR